MKRRTIILILAGVLVFPLCLSAKPAAKPTPAPNLKPLTDALMVWPYEKTVGAASKVKGVFKKDLRTVTIRCGFLNRSSKGIGAARGVLRFTTYFGEPLYDMSLEAVQPIPPGKRIAMNWKLKRENFETQEAFKTFVDTPLEKMRFVWVPSVIVFTDGFQLKP